MSEMLLSSRNLAFELYEVLDAEGLTQRERFAEHNRETFDAAIGTARASPKSSSPRTTARVTRTSRAMRTARRF